jgi:REP element-mobilizing transposase RayT
MPDHIHLCLSIPPKYSVAFVLGFLWPFTVVVPLLRSL